MSSDVRSHFNCKHFKPCKGKKYITAEQCASWAPIGEKVEPKLVINCSKKHYDGGCLVCGSYNRCPVVSVYYRALMRLWIARAMEVP